MIYKVMSCHFLVYCQTLHMKEKLIKTIYNYNIVDRPDSTPGSTHTRRDLNKDVTIIKEFRKDDINGKYCVKFYCQHNTTTIKTEILDYFTHKGFTIVSYDDDFNIVPGSVVTEKQWIQDCWDDDNDLGEDHGNSSAEEYEKADLEEMRVNRELRRKHGLPPRPYDWMGPPEDRWNHYYTNFLKKEIPTYKKNE